MFVEQKEAHLLFLRQILFYSARVLFSYGF